MALSAEQIAFAKELYAPLGQISTRKMFGGLSLYHDGDIFSIMSAHGTLYLKAKGAFADKLAAEGSEIFATADGRSMGYWTLPDAALDDPEIACDWARQALAAL